MSDYDLKVGQSGKIVKINVEGSAAVRLESLGITTGKRVTALAFSLFKSSVMIGCGSVRRGRRKNFAKIIAGEPGILLE